MKRRVTARMIEHLIWLARIDLSKKEKSLLLEQLNEILAYFAKIDEVNTDGIPPTYHVIDLVNIFRGDEVRPSHPEEILKIVPQVKERFVKAPKIV